MNYMSVALKFVKIQKMKLTRIICKNTVKNKSDIKMKELLKSSSFSLEIGGFRMKLCSLILATMLSMGCHVNAIKPVTVETTGEYCIGVDEAGNGWAWNETEIEIGDRCILLLDDKGTDDEFDDEIKGVITENEIHVF